jgi:putative lipoic acid-binding regulatory protein
MQAVIESVVRGLGISGPVTKANTSSNGKYVSFNISTVVESRDAMNRIDGELRRIQGVRMVM